MYRQPILSRSRPGWEKYGGAPEDIIEFPEGIPAFIEAKQFVVVTQPEIAPFGWLLAVDEPDLAFVVVRPADVLLLLELNVEQLAEVELTDVQEALVLAIIVVGHSPEETTVDLLDPVVINPEVGIDKQIIRDANMELACWPLGQGTGGWEPGTVNSREQQMAAA